MKRWRTCCRWRVAMQTCGPDTEVKEPTMRPFRPKAVQWDLFDPPDEDRTPHLPPWHGLPNGTRRRATVLMVRMLLEHRGDRAAAVAGVPGDARRNGESGDV